MFFNLFGKKEATRQDGIFKDLVFIHSKAKDEAILQSAKADPQLIFMAWFADSTSYYKKLFADHALAEERIKDGKHWRPLGENINHLAMLEHHPMQEKETVLLPDNFIGQVNVFSALDEPMFKQFGSEKMIGLIKLLGMKESEAIEHPLVSKSIAKAQDKIAAQVVFEQSADSQQEWLKKNFKSSDA
ncbi:MAG: hypothetical protein WCJ85_02315 [Chitinophagaceae bacterium]